jgi:hypothetical protein
MHMPLVSWAADQCRCSTPNTHDSMCPSAPFSGSQAEQGLNSILHKLHEHKRRRAFFMAFAQNPVDLINALVATQVRSSLFNRCVLSLPPCHGAEAAAGWDACSHSSADSRVLVPPLPLP